MEYRYARLAPPVAQNHGARRQRDHPPGSGVKHVSAHAAGLATTGIWMTDQSDGNVVFKQCATALAEPGDEGGLHRPSGSVRRMHDPAMRMPALAAELILAGIRIAVETHSLGR